VNINIRSGEVPILIRKTAEEIAGCFYELSRTDRFRTEAGSQKQFIRRHWKDHLGNAVQSLAGLLGQPGVPEDQKMQIHEAILELHERAKPGTPKLSMRNWQ
jgi:hypothetical protein